MSSKTPSETASQTQSPRSSPGSVNHRPQISFSPAFTLTEPKDQTAQYQMAMPPLFNALVFPAGCKPRIDSFEFVNDKPIVHSHSHNESRPDSYLHQWNATTWGKFSVIQISDYHFLFMAPRDEEGLLLPNPWDVGMVTSDTYLLKVSKKKEPGELSAYEDISSDDETRGQFGVEMFVAVANAMEAAYLQDPSGH